MLDRAKLPTVSFEDMNSMHYEGVDLINTLLLKIEKGSDTDVTSAIETLLEHMKKHFEYEEGLLKNRGFTMFDIHRNEHTKILGQMRMAYMNWRNFREREALKEFVENEFTEWLNLHIQAMDSVAADFLNTMKNR